MAKKSSTTKSMLGGIGASMGGSIISSLVSGLLENYRAKQQFDREKELMDLQNQYQVAQWSRENAYNDPSAVAERFRAAGINPRAVLEGSANGVGVAGGLSAAPTGGAASPMPFNHLAGLSSNMLAGARLAALVKKDTAEAEKTVEETETEKYNRDVVQPSIALLNSSLKELNISKTQSQNIENDWKDKMLSLEYDLKWSTWDKLNYEIDKITSDILLNESYISLNDEQKDKIRQDIEESISRIQRMVFQNRLTQAEYILTQAETDKTIQEAHYLAWKSKSTEKLIEVYDKQIEKMANEMKLNDAQIKKWKAELRIQFREWKFEQELKDEHFRKEMVMRAAENVVALVRGFGLSTRNSSSNRKK